MKIYLKLAFVLLLPFSIAAQQWTKVTSVPAFQKEDRQINAVKYQLISTDLAVLKKVLMTAPLEFTGDAIKKKVQIILPAPDGTMQRFWVWNSPVMEKPLAERFPQIQTFSCKGIDDVYASGRLDFTEKGFHAMIMTPSGSWFIDPFVKTSTALYQSYYKSDFTTDKVFEETNVMQGDPGEGLKKQGTVLPPTMPSRQTMSTANRSNGTQLYTYRIAIATTGEYSTFHGGTTSGVLSAIITTLNRVTGVYRTELGVSFNLVANNTSIIYLNASTDPYTNSNGGTMLGENQTTLTSVIGSANYDIGHVFSTGGGGVAYLASVCASGNKAGGVTGSSSPVGDPFDIDYVAHEMGHQFGGNHTFNGNTGSCSGNRNATTAYEPGSGTTIMAYAGICSPQNTQSNSDAYFHTVSFDEIITNITTGATGATGCAVITASGNNPPTATVAGTAYTIPVGTPFVLTGAGSDPDGDPVTYYWEQFDLGASSAPNTPANPGPRFRDYTPTTNPSRIIPSYSSLLSGITPVGEILPTAAQTAKFRFTVRDNNVNGGGVTYDANYTTVTFSGAAPFAYSGALTYAPGLTSSVIWAVSGTNTSPVNCTQVNILMSTDGGATYPYTLASATANDGSEQVSIPNVLSANCRIVIESVGNIFFAISPNIQIENPVAPTLTAFAPVAAYEADSVILTGTGFSSVNGVTVGGIASLYTITSDTRMAVLLGSGASGSIEVTNPAGSATLTGFTHLGINPGSYFVVGTGVSTNSVTTTSYQGPLGGYYGGNKTQNLFTASELTAAGIKKGLITSIGFNVSTVVTGSLANYTVKVGTTTLSTIPSTFVTGLTSVYTNSAYNAVTGWNTFTFTTPIYWDGVSNISTETCFNNGNSGYSSGNTQVYISTVATGLSRYFKADNSTTVCASTSSSSTTSRSNTRFYNIAAPTVTASSVTSSNISNTSITLNWVSGNGTSRIVVCRPSASAVQAPTQTTAYTADAVYGLGNTTGANNYVVYSGTGNSVTVTGLMANTTYIFTVYENNGAGIQTVYGSGVQASPATTLPVTWKSVKIDRNSGMVDVKWTTASEYNNKHFQVEYSGDLQTWNMSKPIPSKGSNSNRLLNYQYQQILNETEQTQVLYFRIRQTDYNGAVSFSTIAITYPENKEGKALVIQPNPTHGEVTVFHPFEGAVVIEAVNMWGETVVKQSLTGSKADLSILPPGAYHVMVRQGESVVSARLVIY